jgi:cytochrome P450
MYQIISEGFGHQGLGTEPDFVVHSQQRKLLAPIFSKQAIRDFEKLLLIGVDKLVRALEREGTTAKGVDISVWMHNLLYDVMADLVFGETSGVMDKGSWFIDSLQLILAPASMGRACDLHCEDTFNVAHPPSLRYPAHFLLSQQLI